MESCLVVKHNNLIEARYDLTLNEQKIILYAASKLDRDKDKFNILSLNIRDFFGLLGTTQERYTEIREIVRELRKKEVIINTSERELITGWLSSIDYLRDKGIIELEFSEKLIPYLLQLKERFTRYELKNILYLKNKHSIRIYELMKQYENIGKREFKLDELKKSLAIEEQYDRIYDLERFVLVPAVKEIKEHTDIKINYKKIKTGRRITSILFTIEPKLTETEKIKLNDCYSEKEVQNIKTKCGLDDSKFSNDQILELYIIAVTALQNTEKSPYEYIKFYYNDMIDRENVRNKFAYLKNSLEKDYFNFANQITISEMLERAN